LLAKRKRRKLLREFQFSLPLDASMDFAAGGLMRQEIYEDSTD